MGLFKCIEYDITAGDSYDLTLEAIYSKDSLELSYVCIKDPSTGEYLSGHGNFKHLYFTDNCDSWEKWCPPIYLSSSSFVLFHHSHETYIGLDSDDSDVWWQVWNDTADSDSDWINSNSDSLLVFSLPDHSHIPSFLNSDNDNDLGSDNDTDGDTHHTPNDSPEVPLAPKKPSKKSKSDNPKTELSDAEKEKKNKRMVYNTTIGRDAKSIFTTQHRDSVILDIKNDNPSLSTKEINKLVSKKLKDMWQNLPDNLKQPFKNRAEADYLANNP
tara:strand:+ start:899 stop:1711 length:813 start_codon:yes stop_codon:yes gene_type:complete